MFRAAPQVDPHGETSGKDERALGRNFLPGAAVGGRFLFLHLTADDRSDGVRCILLHLRCGVGVGVQCEACRVVPQGPGESFYVYAVL